MDALQQFVSRVFAERHLLIDGDPAIEIHADKR